METGHDHDGHGGASCGVPEFLDEDQTREATMPSSSGRRESDGVRNVGDRSLHEASGGLFPTREQQTGWVEDGMEDELALAASLARPARAEREVRNRVGRAYGKLQSKQP